ncbi:MAG: response regulator [Myxococcaceae bacterium]
MPNLLVVEDDPDIRELLVDLLGCEGFNTRGAMHGRDALTMLEEGYLPEIILMDLMMPVMDGWALREALVAHPVWGRIPLIVLSASLPPNQSPSFGTFLAKPVDLDRLHGIIRAKLSDAAGNNAAPANAAAASNAVVS